MRLLALMRNSLAAWASILVVFCLVDFPIHQTSFFATMFVLMAIDSDIKNRIIESQKEKLKGHQEPEDAE